MTQLPPSLPPHAVAECEADPSQIGWWTRWAAVGEAKDDLRAALAAWHAAGEALAAHDRECGADDPAECPDHRQLRGVVLVHREALDPRELAVSAAIAAFKAG